jgi:glyceraldehyde-3-phosphate dehydrogenase (NADP+)
LTLVQSTKPLNGWTKQLKAEPSLFIGKKCGNNLVEPVILTETNRGMFAVSKSLWTDYSMRSMIVDDAIASCNDSRWPQAGVFTANVDVAFKLARGIDAGGVMVNDAPTFRATICPTAEAKSGLGLEGIRYALTEMTQPKFICLNLNPNV